MIRSCRAVLNGLRTLSNDSEIYLTLLRKSDSIARVGHRSDDFPRTYNYTKYKGEINSILKQLESDGYLVFSGTKFSLTQKGLHPYQFQWETLKSFLVKSVLVPILVSLATTLITLCITALL